MRYTVVVKRWTPDDYVICYEIECIWHFVAIAVKAFFTYFGWAHVDINKKEDKR